MKEKVIPYLREAAAGRSMAAFSRDLGLRDDFISDVLRKVKFEWAIVIRLKDKIDFPADMVRWAERNSEVYRSSRVAVLRQPKPKEKLPIDAHLFPCPHPQPRKYV